MKPRLLMRPVAWMPLLAALGLVGTQAQVPLSHPHTFPVNATIPDGSFSGLSDTRVLPAAGLEIRSIAVTLVLSPLGEGGFLGDLYATLTHETGGYAVLLNRPGREPATMPFGYSDSVGVNITLADDAPAVIHEYRLTLSGSHTVALADDLSGWWQPDGRAIDPVEVGPADARTALLESFAGRDPGGQWTLFLADVSSGGQYRLDSWTLSVTLIPEPAPAFLLLGLAALAGGVFRRLSRRQ